MNGPVRPAGRIGRIEFVGLMAMLIAMVAVSIDAMLPALPRIVAELTPEAPNRAQLVVTSFMFGLGLGTLCTGPLSDSFGRKPVALAGMAVFILGAASAWRAESLETMIAARVLQGIGAAGPRVIAMAIIRDLYSGRYMAQLMSFVMMVFIVIPALAPSLGAAVIAVAPWQTIFLAFIGFACVAATWLSLRLPETLPPEARLPFRAARLRAAVVEVLSSTVVRLSILAQALGFAALFATLSSTQQVFDQTFGRGDSFHLWFGGIALISGFAGVINALLVVRLGMRFMVVVVMGLQVLISGLCAGLLAFGGLSEAVNFAIYVAWSIGIFSQAGLTIGNLNAIAMEPMGHLAGITASIVGAISTVLAVIFAIPIGLAFDGTPVPLTFGAMVLALLAFLVALRLRRT